MGRPKVQEVQDVRNPRFGKAMVWEDLGLRRPKVHEVLGSRRPTEYVMDLDQQSEMIVFKSLLPNFEARIIFQGS